MVHGGYDGADVGCIAREKKGCMLKYLKRG